MTVQPPRRVNTRRLVGLTAAIAVAGGISGIAALPANAAPASAFTVTASDDAFAAVATPNYKTGALNYLVTGNLPDDTKTAFIKFSVGELPNGATNVNTVLKLTLERSPASNSTVRFYKVADNNWDETSLTAGTAPAVGAQIAAMPVKTTDTGLAVDVSSVVKTNGVYTFAVASSATDVPVRFQSHEGDSGQPTLGVRYTPGSTSTPPATTPPTTEPPVTTPPTTTPPTTTPPTTAPPTTEPPVTTPPTTEPPVTTPPTTAPPTTPPAEHCTVSALLVPSCGAWLGVAPGAHTSIPKDVALRDYEAKTGVKADIVHVYHTGDQLFPTTAEKALVTEPGKERLLLANWKPSGTWAQIANGYADGQIDRLSAHIKTNFPYKFFLAVYHEPENDVNPAVGSGMTGPDYHNMYRHVIQRLRANGVDNFISVVNYMGFQEWCIQPWFESMYPGDDVVDWIAWDPYASSQSAWLSGGYDRLMNRISANNAGWTGFYNWAVRKNKPLMLAEWGVYEYSGDLSFKPYLYRDVARQVAAFPEVKALVHFDSPAGVKGDTRIDTTPEALTAYRELASNSYFRQDIELQRTR